MKKATLIGAIMIGIGAAIYYYFIKNDSKEKKSNKSHENDFFKNEMSDIVVNNEDSDKEIINLSAAKEETSNTIRARHEEAAQIIRESMEHIYEESPSTPRTEESEADEINSQLDDLLK